MKEAWFLPDRPSSLASAALLLAALSTTSAAAADARQDANLLYVAIPADMSRTEVEHPTARSKQRLHALTREHLPKRRSSPDASRDTDLVIMFTDHEDQPILPDLASARGEAASASASTDLTFTFESPDSPWTSEEIATLASALNDFYPTAKTIYGQPAFSISVNLRKDPTISFAGLYFPSLNEMVLKNASSLDALCHEMIHAFRDDDIVGLSSYEEGMTRAAEVEVFDRLEAYTHPFDENHSYTYDQYYEGLNRDTIGSQNGNLFAGYVSPLLRYQLGGYAWAKAFLEDGTFFVDFNRELYARILTDPTASFTEATLVEIAAQAQPSVEGQPFLNWYGQQGVLNTAPPTGYVLYQRINQFTVDYFLRDPSGFESMQGASPIDWAVYDYREHLLDSGSDVTSPNGFIFFFPALPTGYFGRIKVVASAVTPGGPISDIAARFAGEGTGFFGIVSDSDSGTVTITPLDNATSPVSADVVNGAFVIPSLAEVRGRFLVDFTAPDGGTSSRQVNKDASHYFLLLARTVPPPNERCPLGKRFWKGHPESWPVSSLTLGIQSYEKVDLLAILKSPRRGDASLTLAQQLIAAKLNVANGSDPAPVSETIAHADVLLVEFGGRLPYDVRPSSPAGKEMLADAATLEDYNKGQLTGQCSP